MNRPSDRPLRVAFLTNFVSPYRRPVYESLGRTEGWDFRVFTNAATEFDRHWEVDTSQLDVVVSKTWTKRRTIQHEVPVAYEEVVSLHVPTGLFGDLRRFRPDIILSSELGPRTIVASAYGALHRVPVGIWSYHSRTSAACGAKQLRVRRALLGRAAVAIGMGTQAREVLRGWGVEDERIVDALNTTDLTTLESRLAAPEIDGRAQAIKDRIAPGKRIALVLGRLIPLKGIPELLESWG